NVFVADHNDRVQYFTASGSFLGKLGTSGSGNGQFNSPADVAFSAKDARLYVADYNNHRIQYFVDEEQFAVSPTSLGRVKALFR
ncbi:MAG TPA: 6-bladed beta-propeller, partial [bacterium]|nr:6-bladed beta-propeller [bacterium]